MSLMSTNSALIHAIVQYQEDWPGNPGWWRWGRPRLELLTNDELDRLANNTSAQYSTVSSHVAERWLAQDQADWDRKNHC